MSNRFLQQILDKIGLSDENSNDIIEYCYDIIISLIRAKLYLDGYKSLGEGSHEAEISYLMKLDFSETEVRFIDELRYYRNGIKYYGNRFDSEYAGKTIDLMNKVIPEVKKLLLFKD